MSTQAEESAGLLADLEHKLHPLVHMLGKPFNEEGKTWIAGDHISLTHVFGAVLVVVLLALLGLISFARTRNTQAAVVPKKRFSIAVAVELLVETTYNMMSDIMGKKAAKYFLPLIGTCALFILCSNLLGLVPGMVPPTDKLNTTLACALVVLVVTQLYGLKENGWHHIQHFFGPVTPGSAKGLPALKRFLVTQLIFVLMLMIAAIELFGHLIVRPGSLSVRLMANMTADHLVLHTFHTMHPVVAFGVPVIMYMLGLLVCVVQTLVFCLLSTTYIAMAVEHQEDH